VERLQGAVSEVNGVLEELREIARGLHPAALADGGLRPALRSLAHRSAVPVRLDAAPVPDPKRRRGKRAVLQGETSVAR